MIVALACAGIARGEILKNDLGWEVAVDPGTGSYQVTDSQTGWRVGGSLSQALGNIMVREGEDSAGKFREITFSWNESAKTDARRSGGLRLYVSRPAVIVSEAFDDAVQGSPAPFPVLTLLPAGLKEFRFGENDHLRPPTFTLAPKEDADPKRPRMDGGDEYAGPFVLFDDKAHALIVSPADDFMAAQMSGDAKLGLASGLNRTLTAVPAGYRHQTLLAMGQGIHQTFTDWGQTLTDLHGKKRPASDADTGLKYLSYWTDNGAAYYYHYDLKKGYAGTLLDIKKHLDSIGIPIHSMQLDSWWYPKTFNSLQAGKSDKPRSKDPSIPAGTWNRYGGLLEYTPHPDLFPEGLTAFEKQLGVKLITHNRWIDPESPYVHSYKVSGIAPIDPAWWDKIMTDLTQWGVETYEQDWNNYIYLRSPELYQTTWAGDAYLDGMAEASARHGLTLQYCMVLPRTLMQGGAKYSNLTTVRVSGDRLDRGKWREFIYGSELASALGVWPWTDVFRSKETGNFLVCSLSAGMVGLADAIGEEDVSNIFHAVRRDGVIVKPDEPLTPTDETYLAEAGGKADVVVAATRSGDTRYVFAFQKKAAASGEGMPWQIDPQSVNLKSAFFAYDFFSRTGRLIEARQPLNEKLGPDGWSYRILAPVGEHSGMALIGDTGLFITRGRQRISEVTDGDKVLKTTIAFAAGESKITLAAYSPVKPDVNVAGGKAGPLQYDEASGLVLVDIQVDTNVPPTKDADPVRQVNVTLTRP